MKQSILDKALKLLNELIRIGYEYCDAIDITMRDLNLHTRDEYLELQKAYDEQ